jgi:8-oxo-dGTP pyrophosphatase MutT (NUDIX family)
VTRRAHLRSLLSALQPSDARERGHVEDCLALCEAAGDPFARDHWSPGHFTASAFVLSPSGDELLLIYHEKFRRWLQPGGHVEPGDANIVAAAQREVEEETGLRRYTPEGTGLFDVDVHRIPARRADPEHRHFDARVCFRADSRELAAGSDALAARWVPLREVSALESDDSVMRAVQKLLAGGR